MSALALYGVRAARSSVKTTHLFRVGPLSAEYSRVEAWCCSHQTPSLRGRDLTPPLHEPSPESCTARGSRGPPPLAPPLFVRTSHARVRRTAKILSVPLRLTDSSSDRYARSSRVARNPTHPREARRHSERTRSRGSSGPVHRLSPIDDPVPIVISACPRNTRVWSTVSRIQACPREQFFTSSCDPANHRETCHHSQRMPSRKTPGPIYRLFSLTLCQWFFSLCPRDTREPGRDRDLTRDPDL